MKERQKRNISKGTKERKKGLRKEERRSKKEREKKEMRWMSSRTCEC